MVHTWYDVVDPNQTINHAKFESPPLNSAREKPNITVFVKLGEKKKSIISVVFS